MDDNFVEYICDRPRIGSRFFGPEPAIEEDSSDKGPTRACCHHEPNATKRKYKLDFEKEVDDCDSSTAEDERRCCRNFWEFIDSEPILSSLIKEGQFLHDSQPQKLGGCSTTQCCKDDADLPMDDPAMKINMLKVIENRARERELFEERRDKIRQLQLKSGQPLFVQKPCENKKQGNLLAHLVSEDLDAELASVRDYDQDRINSKPLKKKTPSNPFSSLLHENQLVKAEYFTSNSKEDLKDEETGPEEEEYEDEEEEERELL